MNTFDTPTPELLADRKALQNACENGVMRDEKNRVVIDQLTADDMLRELVSKVRQLEDILEQLSENPMLKVMMRKAAKGK